MTDFDAIALPVGRTMFMLGRAPSVAGPARSQQAPIEFTFPATQLSATAVANVVHDVPSRSRQCGVALAA